MHTAFIYFPETGHPMMVSGLEAILNTMFRNMGHDATATWFFDDDEDVFDFTVYGVKVVARDMSGSTWQGLLAAIESYCFEQYNERPVVTEE